MFSVHPVGLKSINEVKQYAQENPPTHKHDTLGWVWDFLWTGFGDFGTVLDLEPLGLGFGALKFWGWALGLTLWDLCRGAWGLGPNDFLG